MNIGYRIETEILQKKYCHMRRTFSQTFWYDQTREY